MSNKGRIRVAVLFGGRSGEHEVSLASARSVMEAMDPERYEAVPVGITKEGRWLTGGDPLAALESGASGSALSAGETPDAEKAPTAHADAAEAGRALVPGAPTPRPCDDGDGRFPAVDVVFPVLHGTYGEDGTVQGLLELADLPYVGAGVLGSALGLDKIAMKAVLSANGLPTLEAVAFPKSRWLREPEAVVDEIEGRFPYPVFAKPANMGSSVGISKAHDRPELVKAIDLAARYDRRVLVEPGLDVREIECAVLGNDDPIASVCGEVVPCNEFYDYRAKYVDGDSALYIPADLTAEQSEEIRRLAVRAFVALDIAGMARADFFLCRRTGAIYVNELNTIPGFTSISMYPKLWEATGLPYPALIDRLIELALERHAQRRALDTSYGFDH